MKTLYAIKNKEGYLIEFNQGDSCVETDGNITLFPTKTNAKEILGYLKLYRKIEIGCKIVKVKIEEVEE